MKIPTTLKHKPVIVSEDYSNVDGRQAYKSDAKGLSLGLASGMNGEKWTSQLRSGGIQENAGLANLRSCLCTGFLIWPS